MSSSAFLGGTAALHLPTLYTHNHRVIGVRTGNLESVRRVWRDVADGFRPIVDRAFPISRADEAHRYLEGSDNLGRVVLTADAASWQR